MVLFELDSLERKQNKLQKELFKSFIVIGGFRKLFGCVRRLFKVFDSVFEQFNIMFVFLIVVVVVVFVKVVVFE